MKTVQILKIRTFLLVLFVMALCINAVAVERAPVSKKEDQQILEDKQAAEDAITAAEDIPSPVKVAVENLPEDSTPQYSLSRIEISGNTLFTQEALLAKIPEVFNASQEKLVEATYLYDLRPLQSIAADPGTEVMVSARSIQGFTQHLLSVYQAKDYAGVYVFVPQQAFEADGPLSKGVLPIAIIEAAVSSVTAEYYDPNNQPSEKQYLHEKHLLGWSPVKEGQPINRRQLDEYIELLNLNPDRYVSATVSRGDEENSLAVEYNVYEANPWHFFVQMDNSGTEDIRWSPRFGVINTSLLGFDDKFTAVYQVVPDSTWNEEYAIFGAYDIPLMGPKLRLNLFAGYSQYDINSPEVNFFRGNGSFYGGQLRYNAFQFDDWFWDITGTIQHEKSLVKNELYDLFKDQFGIDLAPDIYMNLWGLGTELYKTTDMADSFFGFEWFGTISTSDEAEMNLARPGGADDSFNIYYVNARHSRYLDTDKIQRLTGSLRYTGTSNRLVQSKMTAIGGMYTVRGYEETDTIADKGLIASIQYEYDLVRAGQVELFGEEVDDKTRKPFLKKLAPLVFFDYGHAAYNDALLFEDDTDLYSVGGGLIAELGDNFTGTLYYGHPLKATDETASGNGRLHAGLLFRW